MARFGPSLLGSSCERGITSVWIMNHRRTYWRGGVSPGRCHIGVNLSVWWGEAPFWPYDVNEAADVLIRKIFATPDPSPSRGLSCGCGQAHRSTDGRHRFSSPTKCSCNTQTGGSARPSALQDQVTLPASILRSHLQDDREPRPTKLLRPTLKLTPMGRCHRGIATAQHDKAGPAFRAHLLTRQTEG